MISASSGCRLFAFCSNRTARCRSPASSARSPARSACCAASRLATFRSDAAVSARRAASASARTRAAASAAARSASAAAFAAACSAAASASASAAAAASASSSSRRAFASRICCSLRTVESRRYSSATCSGVTTGGTDESTSGASPCFASHSTAAIEPAIAA